MKQTIWAIATGEYSGYAVLALFESQADAEAHCAEQNATPSLGGYPNDCRVEEFDYWPRGERPERFTFWEVGGRTDQTPEEWTVEERVQFEKPWPVRAQRHGVLKNSMWVTAREREAAFEAAEERLAALKADPAADTPPLQT